MHKKIYNIPFDMAQEESNFINQLVTLINQYNEIHDIKLENLVAVLGYERVIIANKLLKLIKKTEFCKRYGLDAVKAFFQLRVYKHINEANDIPYSNDVIMLTSVSSRTIQPNELVNSIPGDTYHQDGKGIPISTKITLTTKRIWTGGTLHLIELPDQYENRENIKDKMIGKSIIKHPGSTQLTLDEREAVIFSNKETLHAVDSRLASTTLAHRTIYQERINDAKNFNYALLINFGLMTPIYSSPSLLSTILSNYLSPVLKMKRFKDESELNQEEKKYIEEYEQPDKQFQKDLSSKLDSSFGTVMKTFEKDGVVVLPGFFAENDLKDMISFFKDQISLKIIDPLLNQSSFNGAVDKASTLKGKESSTVCKAVTSWPVLSVIGHYLGHPPVLANWRGYRLGPADPMLYRAWDWHNDQKRREVKVMVLLNDVNEDGQAMQVIKGSHEKWWNVKSQADTKFNIDEAINLGNKQKISKCYGPAGTLIFFDTNIVHRGVRNLENTRDVMTFNYLPNRPDMALFPISVNQDDMNVDKSYCKIALTRETIENPKQFFLDTLNIEEINNKYNKQKIIGDEQDTSNDETQILVEEYYNTPKYEDIKPRYDANKQTVPEFLFENALNDFSADLDLEIRFGKGDVDRDIQFVIFRDRSPNSTESLRLKEKLSQVKIDFSQLYTIDDFVDFSENLNPLNDVSGDIKSNDEKETTLIRCRKLAYDLKNAFKRCDTIQRLRTNIIYLYATYDCLNSLFPSSTYQNAIDKILAAYAQIICLDDYTYQNSLRKGYGHIKIDKQNNLLNENILAQTFSNKVPEEHKGQGKDIIDNLARSLYGHFYSRVKNNVKHKEVLDKNKIKKK